MPRKRKDPEVTAAAALAPAPAADSNNISRAEGGDGFFTVGAAAAPVSDPPSLEPAPADRNEIETDKGMVTTVTVPLDASGQVAWSSLKKESTKAKIRKLLQVGEASDEKHQEFVGLAKMAPAIWMGIASAGAWALTRRAPGVLHDSIAEAVSYSREELKALAEPTAAMIQKYVPGGLSKWSMEINFAMTVFSIHIAKIAAVQEITAKYTAEQAAKPPEVAQPESILDKVPPPPMEPSMEVPQ